MIELKVIVIDEDEYENHRFDERKMWTSSHVIIRKRDGSNLCVKDRWNYGKDENLVSIAIPEKI